MIVQRGRKVRHVRVSPNDCKKPAAAKQCVEREKQRDRSFSSFSIRSKSGRASNSESDGQSLQRRLLPHRSKKSPRMIKWEETELLSWKSIEHNGKRECAEIYYWQEWFAPQKTEMQTWNHELQIFFPLQNSMKIWICTEVTLLRSPFKISLYQKSIKELCLAPFKLALN